MKLQQASAMNRLALPVLAVALALPSAPAQAQNFFERLFGIQPQQQAPVQPAPTAPQAPAPEEGARRAPAERPASRPMSIRAPSDDNVIGRDLKQNGSNGSLKIERTARGDLKAAIVLPGRRSAQSVETCAVKLGGEEGVPLISQGKPEGVSRYQVADPTCPLQIDILDEAVLVKGPGDICTFQALNCQSDPSGMWGPEPPQLMPRVRDYEAQRAASDRVVRENYRVLVSRARPEQVRPIVAEQAAFSADRETVCQSYAREGTTSFCNAKFTEARALALATRLGVSSLASTGTTESRGRRRPDLPSSDELMQRRSDDIAD